MRESIFVYSPQNITDQDRHSQETESFEHVIFVVGKTTSQTGVVGTIARIGDKSRGCVAARSQVLGQKRGVRS